MDRFLCAAAALALLVLPGPALSQSANTTPPANPSTQDFVSHAALANLFEIAAAEAAGQKEVEPSYKAYAQMMVSDHTRLQNELKSTVAGVQHLVVPSGLDDEHQRMLKDLQSAAGGRFEQQYRASQIAGHRDAMTLFQNYARSGENPKLKAWAKNTIATLEAHLRGAEGLRQVTVSTRGAQSLVEEAAGEIARMKSDPKLFALVSKAKGLYLVPEYGGGALLVGVRGGQGLLTLRQSGGWSDPAFYSYSAISAGAEAGGSGGSIAILLMSQQAVDAFRKGQKFSLDVGAGLSIVNYSANAEASAGKGDVIIWYDTGGAYAGVSVSVTDIYRDAEDDRNFYGDNADMTKILDRPGNAAKAEPLRRALPG